MRTGLIVLFLVFFAAPLPAKRLHYERYYQTRWCEDRGAAEVRLPDGTRCDCLTSTHAVEFDFGDKWSEAIGQSLFYALSTGRKAGIVLILEQQDDYRYWVRLNSTIAHHNLPIDVWLVGPGTK